MADRTVVLTIASVLLAGTLVIGAGIVGAQTASPARAGAPISPAVIQTDVAAAVPPVTPVAVLPVATVAATPIAPAAALSVPLPPAVAAPAESAHTTIAPASTPSAAVPTAAPGTLPVVAPAGATPETIEVTAGGPAGQRPARAPVVEHSVRGTLVSIQGAGLILQPDSGGRAVRVEVTGATLVTQGRQQVTVAALRPGSHIVAVGAPRSDGALAAHAMLVSPSGHPGTAHQTPFPARGRSSR